MRHLSVNSDRMLIGITGGNEMAAIRMSQAKLADEAALVLPPVSPGRRDSFGTFPEQAPRPWRLAGQHATPREWAATIGGRGRPAGWGVAQAKP